MEDENVSLSTSIDFKLGTEEMVDIMIEEQREKLENQATEFKGQHRDNREQYLELMEEVEMQLLKDHKLDKQGFIKQLNGIAKNLKLVVETESRCDWLFDDSNSCGPHNDYYFDTKKHSDLVIEDANVQDLSALESHYKNPMRYLGNTEAYYRRRLFMHNIPETIQIKFQARTPEGTDKDLGYLNFNGPSVTIKKRSAAVNAILRKMKKLAEANQKLWHQAWEADLGLFKLEHGGKRYRARFMKGVLGKSTEGKQIVNLIKNVGEQNLAQIAASTAS